MKTTFNALLGLFLCLFLSVGASAQSSSIPPDTLRLAFGVDAGIPVGNILTRYNFMAGASLRLDVPISRKSYVTASVGYNNFFLGSGATTTQQAILNVPVQTLKTMPLKIGYKYFLMKNFYVHGEAGETMILNKAAVYATNSYAFTYAPEIGMLFKLKKRHTYIDTGIRYEGVSSFYNDSDKYNFWSLHISYAFNL